MADFYSQVQKAAVQYSTYERYRKHIVSTHHHIHTGYRCVHCNRQADSGDFAAGFYFSHTVVECCICKEKHYRHTCNIQIFFKIWLYKNIACNTGTHTTDENDDKDIWFGKIKQVAGENGFATDMKAYKANPSDYKGSVADVAKILRVLVTGREQTPDLYAIMKILGKDKTLQRLG